MDNLILTAVKHPTYEPRIATAANHAVNQPSEGPSLSTNVSMADVADISTAEGRAENASVAQNAELSNRLKQFAFQNGNSAKAAGPDVLARRPKPAVSGKSSGGPYHKMTQPDGVSVIRNGDPKDCVVSPNWNWVQADIKIKQNSRITNPSLDVNVDLSKYENWEPSLPPASPETPTRAPIPTLTPQGRGQVNRCRRSASVYADASTEKKLSWLTNQMSNQWDFEDPRLKMMVWGASAQEAGLTQADIKGQNAWDRGAFSKGDWVNFTAGMDYAKQNKLPE